MRCYRSDEDPCVVTASVDIVNIIVIAIIIIIVVIYSRDGKEVRGRRRPHSISSSRICAPRAPPSLGKTVWTSTRRHHIFVNVCNRLTVSECYHQRARGPDLWSIKSVLPPSFSLSLSPSLLSFSLSLSFFMFLSLFFLGRVSCALALVTSPRR